MTVNKIKIPDMMADLHRTEMKKISNTCQHKKTRFSLKYDAAYCMECREWLENKCDTAGCEQCKNRPTLAPLRLHDDEKEGLRSG